MEVVTVRSPKTVRWQQWMVWAGWVVSCAPVYIVLSSATWKLTSNPWYVGEWGVSGAAALLDAQYGGGLTGARLEGMLEQMTEDLGKRGSDPHYGRGRLSLAGLAGF